MQDQISVGNSWEFLVGGRFDYANTESARNGTVTASQIDRHFSPRVGVVYKPLQHVSLFAGYAESFLPQTGTTFDGSPFEPETSQQLEVGVKAEFLDQRLSVTIAAFDLTRQNILTSDPQNPGFSVQTGEQRSRGVELDITGEILPGWKVIAICAYLDAEVTRDNNIPIGNRLENAAEFSGSLWSVYEIQKRDLQGLSFGAGVFAVGNRAGDLNNTFEVDGYVRTDARVAYRLGPSLKASLNIQNLFDVDYIEAVDGRTSVFPGAPRTVFGTLSLKF